MNMKKSIAGVAAGAMAISAMATVASANVNTHFLNEDATAEREQIVLTYDLATYVEAYKPTTVKIATTYQGAEYFIKGVKEDKINNGDGSSVGASDTGYTVILGNQINNNQWAMGNYYIQSVELQATSVDHGSGNANGINGVRNAEKIWYSRATLGKDLSDMQNKSAAVEDHEHLDVVRDGNNEYAFKVEFNTLVNAVAGDFILDEFEASKLVNADAGVTTVLNPQYTFANAVGVRDTVWGAIPTSKTFASKNAGDIAYIDSKAEALDYSIVAGVNEVNPETNATGIISAVLGTAADLQAIKTAGDAALAGSPAATAWTTLKSRFVEGDAIFAAANAGQPVYLADGGKWTLDKTKAVAYEIDDSSADALLVGDTYNGTALNTAKGAAADGKTAANANGDTIATGKLVFTAADPVVTIASVYQDETVKSYNYYVVKTPTGGFTDAQKITKYDANGYDVAYNPETGVYSTPSTYGGGTTNVVVLADDVINAQDHWKGAASTTATEYSFAKFTVTSTYTVNAGGWDNVKNYTGNVDRYIPLHVGIGRLATDDTLAGTQEPFFGDSAVSVATGGAYDMVKPMKSELSKPADVVASLKARKAGNKYYTSPITVLNDVIANNEEVSFKFVSSQAHIRNTTWVEVKSARKLADGTWVGTIVNPVTKLDEVRILPATYSTSSPTGSGDCLVLDQAHAVNTRSGQGADTVTNWLGTVAAAEKAEQDWYNPVFNQHLYGNPSYTTDYSVNGTTYSSGYGFPLSGAVDGADATGVAGYATGNQVLGNYGSYNYGGWNTNLFNGGLVINSVWTMQLSDTKHFDWGQNSLTFFWSDIKSNTKTNADQFLVSMLLYTPVTWYWDTLEVGVGAAAAEGGNVAMGAGQEDDGAEIEEEEAVEEEIDLEEEEEYFEEEEPEDEDFEEEEEYFEEEEPEDEYFDEFEEEEEEAPEEEETEEEATVVVVEEVASPKTGNSPIALAVIPVALAAAALVAKKKND